MSLRSKVALESNVQMLFENEKRVYFWTFTLPSKMHPSEATVLWRPLCRDLVRNLGMSGVRVFELHPSGHGLHVHLACNQSVWVGNVRVLAKKHGFGRIHVEEFGQYGDCAGYMGKYFSKQAKYWQGYKLVGIRWWSTFGKPFDKIRVKDVVSHSLFKEIFHSLLDFVVVRIMSVPLPEKGDKKSTSRFNFAKMKLAKMIYYSPDLVLGDYDFSELYQRAVFISQPTYERAT